MPSSKMRGLVSTQWLEDHLHDADVVVVDATYYLPNEDKNARALYAQKHLPNAVYFDVDACCDATSPYPHMLPSAELFAQTMQILGISNNTMVVIYDAKGLFSSARLWWMLRVFGHDSERVAVLDGGLPKWEAEGRALDSHAVSPRTAHYVAQPVNAAMVCDVETVLANVTSQACVVMDARGAPRFLGTASEPRVGVRSGHIPHSVNIPYAAVQDAPYGTLKPVDALRTLFSEQGVLDGKPLIASCGSGVTACVLVLALYQLGHEDIRVYDGSWSQWGALEHTPVVMG